MGLETTGSTGSTQQLHQIVGAPPPQQLRFYIYNLKLGIIRDKRRCSSLGGTGAFKCVVTRCIKTRYQIYPT